MARRINVQDLCMNCLQGTIKNGICTNCHSSAQNPAERLPNALPERYLLGKQYYLGKVMGKGGFGITYMAWDDIGQRRLIVKELYPSKDILRDPATGRVFPVQGQEEFFWKCKLRFRQEAQVLHKLRGEPSVVNVYRLIEENNTVYYSMEYLSGFDLKNWLMHQGRMGWAQMSGYARKLLDTLHVLHGQGLIHRDISPDNIILTSQTEAKLIDFGSVRCYNDGKSLTTILKPVYAPPEQYFTNGKQGPWTDIYALSVTMYYALSGKLPKNAMTRLEMQKAGKADMIPLEKLRPDLPTHVSKAITQGMELQMENRFHTVEEFGIALFPQERPSPM